MLKFPRTYLSTRLSSVTNSIIHSVIYSEKLSPSEYLEWLNRFQQTPGNEVCVYCGNTATTVDHLFPIVKIKMPSGYNTERNNLVPCCASCNANKRNLSYTAHLDSFIGKNVPDIEEKRLFLSMYITKYPPSRVDFEEVLGERYYEIETLRNEIHEHMEHINLKLTEIRKIVNESIEHHTV